VAFPYLKGAYRKAGEGLVRAGSYRMRGNGFKLEEDTFRLDVRMKFLYCEGDEMLRHIQRDCECPLPGSIQGQAGWSFEQPGLVGAVPAYSRGLELGSHKGSFQTKSFCDSML